MGRKWRIRTTIKEVIVSPEQIARRKEAAAKANAEIADIQLPQIKADLARHLAIVEQFAQAHGASVADAHLLREQLRAMQQRFRTSSEIQVAQERYARREIEAITESDKQAQGLVRSILFGYIPSETASSQIARQLENIERARTAAADVRDLSQEERAFVTAFDQARRLEESIGYHEKVKKKFLMMKQASERAKQAESRRKEKEGLKEAIVAAFLDRTRELADDIKKQLVDQAVQCPHCPYCGGDYGDEPHADHIYPVSRGGLSILVNMVLVCGGCNLKKSHKTLRQFIVQYKMDRSLIETNLQALGKVF